MTFRLPHNPGASELTMKEVLPHLGHDSTPEGWEMPPVYIPWSFESEVGNFLFSRDRWHPEEHEPCSHSPQSTPGWRSDYSVLSLNTMFSTLTNCISICHLSHPTFPDLMPNDSNRLIAACIYCSFLTPLPHSTQSSQTSLLNIVFVLRQFSWSKVITSWLLRWWRY